MNSPWSTVIKYAPMRAEMRTFSSCSTSLLWSQFFFKKPQAPLRKRSLNHLLLPEISKVEDYLFSISKNTKRTQPSTVISCLIILRDKFTPGLCLTLTYINYFFKMFLAEMEAIFHPTSQKQSFTCRKGCFTKYPPYGLPCTPFRVLCPPSPTVSNPIASFTWRLPHCEKCPLQFPLHSPVYSYAPIKANF